MKNVSQSTRLPKSVLFLNQSPSLSSSLNATSFTRSASRVRRGLTTSAATTSAAGPFRYELIKASRKSKARVGRIHTPHGTIETPGFVAVATNGTLKSVDFPTADAAGCELVFCNTAHFLVNTSPDHVAEAGGLHGLIGRHNKPLITDSSGFQIYSWKNSGLVKWIDTEKGVQFKSYRNGDLFTVTPESCIQVQAKLGADIAIVLDELIGFDVASRRETETSLERSHIWAQRCAEEHVRLGGTARGQALYAVVHGGFFPDLRMASAKYLSSIGVFDGYAVGGSLGASGTDTRAADALIASVPLLPYDKPIHLLGIGDIPSISRGVLELGIDTFDSAFPTKNARHGMAYVDENTPALRIGAPDNAKRFHDPIDKTCPCPTCKNCSIAYMHHLTRCQEHVVNSMLAVHNLTAMHRFMARLRARILADEI